MARSNSTSSETSENKNCIDLDDILLPNSGDNNKESKSNTLSKIDTVTPNDSGISNESKIIYDGTSFNSDVGILNDSGNVDDIRNISDCGHSSSRQIDKVLRCEITDESDSFNSDDVLSTTSNNNYCGEKRNYSRNNEILVGSSSSQHVYGNRSRCYTTNSNYNNSEYSDSRNSNEYNSDYADSSNSDKKSTIDEVSDNCNNSNEYNRSKSSSGSSHSIHSNNNSRNIALRLQQEKLTTEIEDLKVQLHQLEMHSHPKYLKTVENLKLKRDEKVVEINECRIRSLKTIEDEYNRDICEISDEYYRQRNELKRKLIWNLKRKMLEINFDRTHMQIYESVENTFSTNSVQLRSHVSHVAEPSQLNFILKRQEIEEDLKKMKIPSIALSSKASTYTTARALHTTTERLPNILGSSELKTISHAPIPSATTTSDTNRLVPVLRLKIPPHLRYVPKLSKKRYPKSMDNSLFTKKKRSSSNAKLCRAKILRNKLHFNDRRFRKNDIVIIEQINNTEEMPSVIVLIGNDFIQVENIINGELKSIHISQFQSGHVKITHRTLRSQPLRSTR